MFNVPSTLEITGPDDSEALAETRRECEHLRTENAKLHALLAEHGILASPLISASAILAPSKAEIAVATHPVDAAAFVALNPSEKIALFRRLLLLFDIVDKQQIAWDVCDEFVVDDIPF